MSSVYMMVPHNPAAATAAVEHDIGRFCAFKSLPQADAVRSSWAIGVLLGTVRNPTPSIGRDDSGNWLCSSGTWIHREGIASDDPAGLLGRYLAIGAERLALELEGAFVILIGDARDKSVNAITDICGSLHLYCRKSDEGIALCTSSAALSQDARLDMVGTHEFIATGIVYENRSLWQGVNKLPPASVVKIDQAGMHARTYWRIGDLSFESLSLEVAVDQVYAQLVAALQRTSRNFSPLVADLTGGYDSRMLLCGLLGSGVDFESTVSGPESSADVRTANEIARHLHRPLHHSVLASVLHGAQLLQSIRLCDGEYNAFDFARILAIHQPASTRFAISLNGSFGEIARGYWWELLWPALGAPRPVDTTKLSARRFAAAPYDQLVFAAGARLNLGEHMRDVANRALSGLEHLPNSSQMDALYFTLRMQRWQGRIASTTNQIWPAISPIAYPAVLEPILSAKSSARFRSLLARRMFAKYQPVLAEIPLEHGYPPAPFSLGNAHRFWPILSHYGARISDKISTRMMPSGVPAQAPQSPRERFPHVFSNSALATWLAKPLLLKSGHFEPETTLAFLNPDQPLPGGRLEQWQRMCTVEWTLRLLQGNASAA